MGASRGKVGISKQINVDDWMEKAQSPYSQWRNDLDKFREHQQVCGSQRGLVVYYLSMHLSLFYIVLHLKISLYFVSLKALARVWLF